MKICKKCNINKELSQFSTHHTNLDGLAGSCKECSRLYGKKWYGQNKEKSNATSKKWRLKNPKRIKELLSRWQKNNPHRKRTYRLKTLYGITIEDYSSMLNDQDYKCKICSKLHNDSSVLHVDHDHISGAVRGLLCSRCNTMLGNAKDDPIILANAIAYLKKSFE